MKKCNCPNHHHNHENHDITKIVEFLDNDKRNETYSPEKILGLLPINKDNIILDLGAGTGFLTIPSAKSTDNTVYALDLNEKMLDIVALKSKEKDIKNIELIKSSIDAIPLDDNSIDISLASLILHEVKSLPKTLAEINRVLKNHGHLLCLEYEAEDTYIEGPALNIRIPSKTMSDELSRLGFTIINKVYITSSIYVLVSKKI